MHPEVRELEPRLKAILYDCAVEIRATKAALFLYDGDARFELVSEFGFRGTIRESADNNDPIVDRCGRGRSPFYINGLSAEPRFSEVLYEASTDRLLVAPIYARGALIGFIDMRDKGGRAPFENSDLPKAQSIAERFVEAFANMSVFGQRFITVSGDAGSATVTPGHVAVTPMLLPTGPSRAQAPPAPAAAVSPHGVTPAPPAAAPAPQPVVSLASSPHLAALILEARSAVRRMSPPKPDAVGESELSVVRDVLRCILLIPNAVVVAFSSFGKTDGVQEIASRGTLTFDAAELLQEKLNNWLTKRGKSSAQAQTSYQAPFGLTAPPITAPQLRKVVTAPLSAGSIRDLYLTVGFTVPPDRTAHELLAAMHGLLQTALEASLERGVTQAMRLRMAEKLLEPDFSKLPELRQHSDAVVNRAEALAWHLAMPQAEVDQVTLVARVHDVGMRLLEYERLYRKTDMKTEEKSILREHAAVGAALVEPLLGSEIARAVLCHHERWDGRGYPNALRGEEIPRLARIVQLCDVYESMVSTDNNYQPPVPREVALTMIRREAGRQFDPEAAGRFLEMMGNHVS